MIKRCDGVSDCVNDFDEMNCTLVIIKEQLYRKEIPPVGSERVINITTSLTVLSIANIDEMKQTYVVKFNVSLHW